MASAPDFLVVVDHHEAHVYHLDVVSEDEAVHAIKPHDPHHFRHHLRHRDQDAERGQKSSEDPAFYAQIAEAVISGGRIVLVGHGKGDSNAAHHLHAYLQKHHRETAQHVIADLVSDLSSVTTPQLLALGRKALERDRVMGHDAGR